MRKFPCSSIYLSPKYSFKLIKLALKNRIQEIENKISNLRIEIAFNLNLEEWQILVRLDDIRKFENSIQTLKTKLQEIQSFENLYNLA